MKKGNLKVGVKDPKFHIAVEIDVAENLDDVSALSKGHLPYIIDCFMRGHRINLQESDARAKVAELVTGKTSPELADAKFLARTKAEVEKVLKAFDPTAERKRGGRPAKPVNVQVDANRKYTAAEMQEMLRAAGAKVQFVTGK